MELWGGVECTINRVGNTWLDQCTLSGHDTRVSDIDLFAACGLCAIRYPILWEKISPDSPDTCDWGWVDPRLRRLREHGLRVIVGLVHHGSGPRYTDLLDPGFAPGLARHARAVAERFPWITDWTPVNEPVTTARFSCLYGLWYPHRRDEGAFWLALLNQIDGTRLAMRAIRQVNPAARLIQTDDLGRTYATAPLRGQVGFDNLRRWAGWDLLCGRVTSVHPLHARIARFGLGDRLRIIADDPCPPDMIGVNHYLTSDRYLDHRTRRYPGRSVGGNGRDRYVDLEAIRVLEPAPQGLPGALREAWQRYSIPLALTEVHNGCTREEQMRWLARAWDGARALSLEGIDIRAVTSWALLGSAGWNTLLTRPGVYESGTFDVASGAPRPTARADLMRGLPRDAVRHPVVAAAGWWERSGRLHHAVPRTAPMGAYASVPPTNEAPLLICGASGTLGRALARACRGRNVRYVPTSRNDLPLGDEAAIEAALDRHHPWAVINAAGWVRVDAAEHEEQACVAANVTGAAVLAKACAAQGIATVGFSSDLVFDGRAGRAYHEGDTPRPLNAYGRSKLAAEEKIGALPGDHLVIRTAAFFSPFDRHNFAWAVVDTLRRGDRFQAIDDESVSPTYVPHLAEAVLDLTIDRATGLWHVTHGAAMSWHGFAIAIAEACGLDASLIDRVTGSQLAPRAKRPPNSALASRQGPTLPEFDAAIGAFAAEMASIATDHRKAA